MRLSTMLWIYSGLPPDNATIFAESSLSGVSKFKSFAVSREAAVSFKGARRITLILFREKIRFIFFDSRETGMMRIGTFLDCLKIYESKCSERLSAHCRFARTMTSG